MILPIQITFRNMESSDEAEEWIRKEGAKLDEFYSHIMACRVVVEFPSRHRKFGSLYHVRIDLTVPGGELVVKREPSLHSSIQQIGKQRIVKHLEVKAPHRAVFVHEGHETGDQDLLNLAVVQTILHGGSVYALDSSEMPDDSPAAALLRY